MNKVTKLGPGPMPLLRNVTSDDTDDGFRKTLTPRDKHRLDTIDLRHLETDMKYNDMSGPREDNTW